MEKYKSPILFLLLLWFLKEGLDVHLLMRVKAFLIQLTGD